MARPSKRRSSRSGAVPSAYECVLAIDEVGWHGEGMAHAGADRVFVPYTLAGEQVRVAVAGDRGRLLEIVQRAAERTDPFCQYFGTCGGCALQHMADDTYARWKRDVVETALHNRGIQVPVEALIDAHGRGRRRATFHVAVQQGKRVVGFSAARSHSIVDLEACPIVVPELAGSPARVRALAAAIGTGSRLDVQLTKTSGGIDVHITGVGDVGLQERRALAGTADALDLARIAVDGETIAERRSPAIQIGVVSIVLPSGAFLQATEAGEHALATLVESHLGGARRIADLFAGVGVFGLRLASSAAVLSVDSDTAAIAALSQAARRTRGLKPVETEVRDLQRRPLAAGELDRFDAVVFDPPRAGAEAQARALAGCRVPRIAAVSCNPATFARDAAILINGGYRLIRVCPVDQFKWSPHVEIVGLFQRG